MTRLLLLLSLILIGISVATGQTTSSIADAKKQEFGTVVGRVAGRITAASGEFRNTSYIQDGTAGIAVFNATFRVGVQVGDSVVIDSATLTEFGQSSGAPGTGLTELSGANLRFTVVPVTRVAPAPRTTTIPLIGEGVEGQLIRVRRVTFLETGAFQGETNYNVRDGQGNDIAVRIDGGTEIAINSLPIPTGQIDLIGLVSQFRGGYQIIPRYAEDVSLEAVEDDTVNPARTLDVTTWNLDWFGWADTTRGPSDKERQNRSIRQVMDSVGADLYALQEVTSEEALSNLADSISGSYVYLYPSDIPSDQKMAYIYNSETITPISSGLAVNGGSQAWAGGRFPYRLTFTANIAGNSKTFVVFNIHGKATSDSTAMEDYNRRKTDAETFHAYLSDFYADSSLIFTGDYNDMLTSSVVDSTLTSPYEAFLTDTERWQSPTLPLEERGLSSFIGFERSFLDHFFITTDVVPTHYRTYLEAPQAFLSSYSSTVSDHLPVTLRIYMDGTTDVAEENHIPEAMVRVAPNPMIDHGMAEVIIESAGHLRIVLVDALGNSMQLVDETVAPQIRLVPIPLERLSAGSYQLMVTIDRTITTVPIVVLP